jgi:hypothetical protein
MRGASERLSPLLMTALATALALAPLVFYGDRPGQEIEYPMAVVILGGLLTSTLLTCSCSPCCTWCSAGARVTHRKPALPKSAKRRVPPPEPGSAGPAGPGRGSHLTCCWGRR